MARPDQETIDTFITITGVSEAAAIQILEECHGNLNQAVNAHFSERDRNIVPEADFVASQDDVMDVDDPMPAFTGDLNEIPPLDPDITRVASDSGTGIVQNIGHTSSAPITEDASENARDHGPETRGIVISDDDDDDDDENITNAPITRVDGPTVVDRVPDYSNEIEEAMIQAAIEASKHDTAMPSQTDLDTGDPSHPTLQPVRSHLDDVELAHAVSLSLQTAEKEKVRRELGERKAGDSEIDAQQSASPQDIGKSTFSDGRQHHLERGSSSIQVEADDVEELEPARHRRRRVTSSSIDTPEDIGGVEVNPPLSPQQNDNIHHAQHVGSDFPSDEWGGISSVEHDEAVMLEAAMFGGIPEGTSYHFPYTPRQLMQNGLDTTVGSYPVPMNIHRPPSPSLTAQRLIREQQDDEYLASLEADRVKELKAKEEAEAALAEERRKEDEILRQQLEEQEIERQLAAKLASLPQEPTPDDENAVTLLVRMPDGSRRGRRFRKSDTLQCLFDFIDVGRGVKPSSYRLVRPYPRRAFGDGESNLSLNELGLTSKQEALYLELI